MHAVYNYSGFVDLFLGFDPQQTPTINDHRSTLDQHYSEQAERPGETVITSIPSGDVT
jgi:hypothetical protein